MNLTGDDFEYKGNVIAFPQYSSKNYLVGSDDTGKLLLIYMETSHSSSRMPVSIEKLTNPMRLGKGAVVINRKNNLDLYRHGKRKPGDQSCLLFSRSIAITNKEKISKILENAKLEIANFEQWDDIKVIRAGWGSVLSAGVDEKVIGKLSDEIAAKQCPYELGLGRVQLSGGEYQRHVGVGFIETPYPLLWFKNSNNKPSYFSECEKLWSLQLSLISKANKYILGNEFVNTMRVKDQLMDVRATMIQMAAENGYLRAHADLYFPEKAIQINGSQEQFTHVLKSIDKEFTQKGCYGACSLRIQSSDGKVIPAAEVFLSAEYRAKKRTVDLLSAKGSLFLKYNSGLEMLNAITAGTIKVDIIPIKRENIAPSTKESLVKKALVNLKAHDSGSLVPQDDKGLSYLALSKIKIKGNELVTRVHKISQTLSSSMKVPLRSSELIKGNITLANEAIMCILRADEIAEKQALLKNDLEINPVNVRPQNEHLTFS